MTETHHSLKNDRLAFRHDQNVVVDAGFARTCQQPGERFVQRLVTEPERAVMHRHEFFCAQFQKGLHCFLWIHMHLTPAWRVVAPIGKSPISTSWRSPISLNPGN